LPNQLNETDYARRKQEIANRTYKLRKDVEDLRKRLQIKPKPESAEELSSRDSRTAFSGSVTDFMRWLGQQSRNSRFELSQNTEERDVELKRKVDKTVELIIEAYRNEA
jgi:hypothetical protein